MGYRIKYFFNVVVLFFKIYGKMFLRKKQDSASGRGDYSIRIGADMKYKYIHIFTFSSLQFDESVVKTLNDKKEFVPKEHMFVSRSQEEYDKLKKYENVILDIEDTQLINKYADGADWIIVHGLPFVSTLCKVKKKFLRKIIWRTWGSDAGYILEEGRPLKNFIKRFLNFYYGRFVHRLAAVGVANVVDSINLQELYGELSTFVIPYCTDEYEIVEKIKRDEKKNESNSLSILIGHAGFQNDNHLEMIGLLKRFAEEDIKLFFILSYGDPKYINDVKNCAEKCFGEKAVFLEEKMSYDQYAKMINSIDIAILDGKRSYALGNIQMLLYLGKQLYVNEHGVIKEGLDMEGIPYRTTAELKKVEYNELKQVAAYEIDAKSSMTLYSYDSVCEYWHLLLNYLEVRQIS